MEHRADRMRDILIVDDYPIIRQGLARKREGLESPGDFWKAGDGWEGHDTGCHGQVAPVIGVD